MACHAMLNTRQPAMPAPGRPGRVRRDAAGGTVSAASGTVSSDVPGASAVPGVPWWGVVSAVVAPVLLISGWTFAAGVQRGTYNAVADTVSALAAEGAADRWVMTLAFLAAGVFEVVTGLSLRPAAAAGRLILMAGGVAGVLVAASPEPAGGGGSVRHMSVAAAGLVALAAWPAAARRRGPSVPWGLRPAASAGASAVLLAVLLWFGAELLTSGGQAGLAERLLGGLQTLWPVLVILSCRLSRPGPQPPGRPVLQDATVPGSRDLRIREVHMTTTTNSPGRGAMIDVEGVSKSFGETRALAGVDMSVPAGTVQGLLGPNGAGKTTMVRILATLLAPDTGRARISGVDVQKDPNTVRSLIGLAGQYAAVDETLTGRENLVMVGRLYRLGAKLAKARAVESLERLGLVEAADRPVKTYSGGMRRRLDLGASLVGRPRVLILDEPTTGLDPRTRLDMWSFIRDLVAEGTTVLLTTQYLEEADQLANHSVVIDRGQVIASGTSDELKARLGSDLIAIEVQAAELDRATAALRGIGCGAPAIDQAHAQITIPVCAPVPDLMAALRILDRAGIVPVDLGLRRPSLDDVFLSLTGRSTGDDDLAAPLATTPRAPRPARSAA